MQLAYLLPWSSALAPAILMLTAALLAQFGKANNAGLWNKFILISWAALFCTATQVLLGATSHLNIDVMQASSWLTSWLTITSLGGWMALLVQLLGTIIAVFSYRYLQGEPRQRQYVTALACVLAAVHVLLLANNWLVLIVAWAMVGVALQHLLCFYPDRPFALLAAHKKRIADRLADVLLIIAAVLAWREVGSGSLSDLWKHLAIGAYSIALQLCAVCVVLAVIMRTALLPVHGWLTQVMEAPTPVSALLHAGVVNLGGFVLIRFAPLLEAAPIARWLLVVFGLGTALLAGLVMLTRISIKVRLAWSTVAQMGFMVLECGLGMYSLAALHLIGHSLYKAHAFLSASSAVKNSKLQMMRGSAAISYTSLVCAPLLSIAIITLFQQFTAAPTWPWWWNGILALSWAPLLWLPVQEAGRWQALWWRGLAGVAMTTGLTLAASIAHVLPLGVSDAPKLQAGVFSLIGMTAMYLCLAKLQMHPRSLAVWRRWSYAGFYVDEIYTRLALQLWPTRWARSEAYEPKVNSAFPIIASH